MEHDDFSARISYLCCVMKHLDAMDMFMCMYIMAGTRGISHMETQNHLAYVGELVRGRARHAPTLI
jgi:hypothetical protein